MNLAAIRARLARHQPRVVDHQGYSRAAVALLLREQPSGVEMLLIQRSERAHDPWSGHMALPGGREDPSDGDLVRTAARETHEEVGIDLATSGELICHLDDVQAQTRSQPIGLIIRPHVYALSRDVVVQPDGNEVQNTVWLPLSFLTGPDAVSSYVREFDGVAQDFPAFVYEGYTVWGLTYRMLSGFLELVR